MPWMTWIGAAVGVHGVGSPAEFVERRQLHHRPHATNGLSRRGPPFDEFELFLDRGIFFRADL